MKFKKAMKEKRTGKQGKSKDPRRNKEEIVVQRLSADVTGKAQKYSRIGPREFVKVGFDDDELTIEKIKDACLKHFAPQTGRNVVCDVLAGELGPSCCNIKQVPDLKLIYVRFISDRSCARASRLNVEDSSISSQVEERSTRKRQYESSVSYTEVKRRAFSVPSPKKAVMHKPVPPKSISVSQMLKLGKVVESPEVVNLYQFDLSRMRWSTTPKAVEFNISKDLLGEGAFRRAYKARTNDKELSAFTWVVKEYTTNALEVISETKQSVEAHTRKVVQMHCLAQNFANQLRQEIEKANLQESFGPTLKYGNIYLGKKGEEYVTVEEYVEGKFDKYINNDGKLCYCGHKIISEKAECLAHYSYEKSNHELMLLDIQGCGYRLFDPEIASAKLVDDEDNEILFTAGNLSKEAISTFFKEHVCNYYCDQLGQHSL